jgi:malonyl-CoA/methylmalonyl-CoA synthetase
LDAHDKDGWFKTGDFCRREGPYYFILGRASVDMIKSGGYKISALEVERELLDLPYIAEAMVIGVEDDEFGQRIGAVVTLQNSAEGKKLLIDGLRGALRKKLPGYKLPTLLRIFEGEIPKGPTGKVQKKVLGPKLFPVPGWTNHPKIQVWKVKPKGTIMAKI